MRIVWRMRLLALGDRNPDFLTHREIDSTLKLLPADVDCRWVATDDPRARELASYDGVWLLPGTRTAMTRLPTPRSATAWRPALRSWAPAAVFSTRQWHWPGPGSEAGVVISAYAADAGPEALELAEYPFFLATAFQPQVGSSQSGELHPVLSAWLRAAAAEASAAALGGLII